MNYMFNIPQTGHSQITAPVPITSASTRTIVLSSPSQVSQSTSNGNSLQGNPQHYPVVMPFCGLSCYSVSKL